MASPAIDRCDEAGSHYKPVGEWLMTEFGAIDQGTTMGTATGDLSGAVSRTLLGSTRRK